MKFSEDSQNNYFFSQPHQPFFILAFTTAMVTMIIFFLDYKEIIHMRISPSNFHAYGFTYLLFTPVFLGFLFTTFPRFSSTPAIKQNVYMRVFSLYYIGATLFLLGSIVSPFLSAVGMITLFIGQIMGTLILKNIYKTSTMEDKDDIFWILVAMGFGLFAHLLFIVGETLRIQLIGFSLEISTYLYLFLLTFTMAQRMVPFFSHSMIEKNKKLLLYIFILLLAHIFIEGFVSNGSFLIDIIIGLIIGKELLRWKLSHQKNPLLWILHISVYWIPVGFILSGVTNFSTLAYDTYFMALDVHVILLGFVFSMLIGFTTRVTLGHSDNTMMADKGTILLFLWTQVVILIRILTSFSILFSWDTMFLFDISVIVWLVMFIAWAIKFFMVLIVGKKLKKIS